MTPAHITSKRGAPGITHTSLHCRETVEMLVGHYASGDSNTNRFYFGRVVYIYIFLSVKWTEEEKAGVSLNDRN